MYYYILSKSKWGSSLNIYLHLHNLHASMCGCAVYLSFTRFFWLQGKIRLWKDIHVQIAVIPHSSDSEPKTKRLNETQIKYIQHIHTNIQKTAWIGDQGLWIPWISGTQPCIVVCLTFFVLERAAEKWWLRSSCCRKSPGHISESQRGSTRPTWLRSSNSSHWNIRQNRKWHTPRSHATTMVAWFAG